ncbi:uncharacterized protein LOC34618518, partial [Cyclospora cayetanensis]|uniref:Uncharacterized protein LOC34618518 n=1 Tax=Cyclospora cayetanensis TaxID=88456 RepID=A0A6P6RZ66_9EIME
NATAEPGREKWFMPFIILLAILLAAAIVALCVHCLNVRSLRKREAIKAQQAAPEIFHSSDTEAPTPRERRGIWEPA